MKKLYLYLLCAITAVSICACGKKEPAETVTETVPETTQEATSADVVPETSVATIESFIMNEDSKVYLVKDSEDVDITEYIDDYSDGELFITEEGLASVFNLTQTDTPLESELTISQAEADNNFYIGEGKVITLKNDKRTITLKDESRIYMSNDQIRLFAYPVTSENDKMIIPMSDIAMEFGYVLSCSVDSDSNCIRYRLTK